MGNRVIGLYEINVPNVWSIIQANNIYVYCGNNPIVFFDPNGLKIAVSENATKEELAEYERAILYLEQSPTWKKLYDKLEAAPEIITVEFIVADENNSVRYNYESRTIYWDVNLGLVLMDNEYLNDKNRSLDDCPVQSAALGLAHEMGHAAHHLDGITRSEAGQDFVENYVLSRYETPIANELKEPIRNVYDEGALNRNMNNSTHYITVTTHNRPWHYYIWPLNWGKPKTYKERTEHNSSPIVDRSIDQKKAGATRWKSSEGSLFA